MDELVIPRPEVSVSRVEEEYIIIPLGDWEFCAINRVTGMFSSTRADQSQVNFSKGDVEIINQYAQQPNTLIPHRLVCEELWPGVEFECALGRLRERVDRVREKIEKTDWSLGIDIESVFGRGYKLTTPDGRFIDRSRQR